MTPAELMDEYARRTNTHRFAEVAELIAEHAVYWFSDGSYRGRQAIEQAFKRTWAVIQEEQYRIDDLEWVAVGESVATCIYRFGWQGIVGGQPRQGAGRGTSILHKLGGRWLVVHEHLSPIPADEAR